MNYSYLSDGTKLSALDGSGEGLVYRGPFVYRKRSGSNAGSSLTLESAAFGGGLMTPSGAMLYVTDYLGSVRAVVDGKTGELYKASDYSAFGDESVVMVRPQGNTPPQPLAAAALPTGLTLRDGYTGKEAQTPDFSTGYTDFGARQYSPTLRRWMTPDPLSEKYYGVSPYAFCNNNPVNFVDPDGEGIYEINSRGNIKLIDDTDEVHQLYQIDDEGQRTGNMIELSNSDALESLSKLDNNQNSTYRTDSNIDNIFKIFEFVTDNTDVEWAVHRSQGDEYLIGTSHNKSSVDSYSVLSGNVELPIASVHSHTNENTYAGERFSMGYDGGWIQYGNDHQKTHWGTVPKYNYVYFPRSKRLYNVERYRPRYIRTINSYKDFYFGTLNYK